MQPNYSPSPVPPMTPSPFDPASIISNVNQQQAMQPTEPAGPKKKGKGNWFTHLLPTIGSVAVPAIGGMLAPVTGGLSLLAAAGLSGAGAAGGKALQNAMEGEEVLDDNLITAGGEGLVGGLAGGVLGKALGKGANMLSGQAGKMATKKATTAAAEDAIEGIANTYKDVSPQLQKLYGAKDGLKHVKDMGFDPTDPSKLIQVSKTSNDTLNDVLNKALHESGPVQLDNYADIVKKHLAAESGTLGSFDPVALSRGRIGPSNSPAAKLLSQLEKLGAGVAKKDADPMEIRELTSKLYSLARDAKPTVSQVTGAIDPEQRAAYKVISNVRNDLKSALYDRPEVNKVLTAQVGNLTPEDVGSPQLAEYLNGIISKAGTPQGSGKSAAQDFLDVIRKNIDIENFGNEGQKVAQIVTSTGGKARAAAEAGLGQPGMDTHPLLESANGIMNSGGGGVMSTALKGATHLAQNPAVLDTVARAGNVAAKVAPAAGSIIATSPNLQADPVNGSGTMEGTMNNQTGTPNGQSQDVGLQTLVNAMAAQAILAPNLAGSSGATSFLGGMAPMMQKNQLLEAEMGGLPTSFDNAGGAQGTGGLLSKIAGLIPGTAANTYEANQRALAAQLAQAMGISPEQAAGLLPQLMQNEQSAGNQMGILDSLQGQLVR